MKSNWKNLSWKKRVLTIVLAAMVPVQFLNFTGFCYSEMRYLSDLELTYAGVTFPDETELSPEDRQRMIQREGEPFPFCCRVDGEPSWIAPEVRFVDKLLGHYVYRVVSYSPNPHTDAKDYQRYPYYVAYSSINACGKDKNYETGTSKTREVYEANIQQIKKFWEGKYK